MRKQDRTTFREYAFQLEGRHVALNTDECSDGTVQVGFTIVCRDDKELIGSEEVLVTLLGDEDRPYNCTFRAPTGPLPLIHFGATRAVFAGFKFQLVNRKDHPRRIQLGFQHHFFELEYGSDLYRTDNQVPKLPEYFPLQVAAKYDQDVSHRES